MKQKKQTVYLDMDGTIYDLYHRTNWLERLREGDETVFWGDYRIITENDLLYFFPEKDFEIRILSMTPKGADDEFCQRVIETKNRCGHGSGHRRHGRGAGLPGLGEGKL